MSFHSDPIQTLLHEGVIDEVISRLKSGKEADIYLVRHSAEIVAAKVYKERHARSFHNNAAYKEGRVVGNSRTQRAMAKGSRFGREAEEDAWKEKESEVLHKLFASEVRVPKPVLFYEGILLMEAVIDAEGFPAPRLIDAHIPRELAATHYADLRQQMVKILMCDLIHGDLSPYNVLLAWNGPTIIDFPQVVGAAHNSQASFFFLRDFETLWRFFSAIDPSLQSRHGDGEEIWRAYTRRELSVDFVPTGRGVAPRHEGGRRRRGRGGSNPNANASPNPATPRAPPGPRESRRVPGKAKSGPVVSYVGDGKAAAAPATSSTPPSTPDAATGIRKRRRRRRR